MSPDKRPKILLYLMLKKSQSIQTSLNTQYISRKLLIGRERKPVAGFGVHIILYVCVYYMCISTQLPYTPSPQGDFGGINK